LRNCLYTIRRTYGLTCVTDSPLRSDTNGASVFRQNRLFVVNLQHQFSDQPHILRIGVIHTHLLYERLVPVEAAFGELAGTDNLCLAGGVALNCKMNMEIGAEPSVGRLYVPPVPHDAGVALGAAMLKCAESGHEIAPLTHAYWGPEYSNDEIRSTLDKVGARYELLDDPVQRCVVDLDAQKTVGWFQGRMEYGPRALGNRSILADPRSAGMKDRINVSIKYREEFRPFCPSVLYDRQADYFQDTFDAPFMVVTFPVVEATRERIPAVVHVDGTARIQSVHADTNPLYSRLIEEFARATSVPLLINTSLNINEQPTVNAPLEALHTFFCSGLDVLFLGPYRLSKPV